jgi:hypothetical protein
LGARPAAAVRVFAGVHALYGDYRRDLVAVLRYS